MGRLLKAVGSSASFPAVTDPPVSLSSYLALARDYIWAQPIPADVCADEVREYLSELCEGEMLSDQFESLWNDVVAALALELPAIPLPLRLLRFGNGDVEIPDWPYAVVVYDSVNDDYWAVVERPTLSVAEVAARWLDGDRKKQAQRADSLGLRRRLRLRKQYLVLAIYRAGVLVWSHDTGPTEHGPGVYRYEPGSNPGTW